ncbi:MAG: 50S ribosomal protein L3 [Bacillales bacterium]|nr:50S ribosomal protein L3 [Bacillales bacterium]
MKSILGRKMGMTQVFAQDGTMYPVTVVEVLPNVVTQVKTEETDDYNAIQVGYEDKKENRCNKAELGIFKKAGVSPKYELAELKGDEMMNYAVGQSITCDIFAAGDVVDVTGVSKGKGFSGAIKRWHFTIGPKGHGSGYHRGAGSYATNGRYNRGVMKGKKAAGHHGNKTSTILNLTVISVDPANNAILIKGAIPGPKKSIVTIRSAVKAQRTKPVVKPLVNYTPVANEGGEEK